MERYHPLKELAPRDVVSRAIVMEIRRTGSVCVYLDLTHLDGAHLKERFPRIYETCLLYGVDLATQPAPVHPAAHYAMGGVKTNLDGRATLPRLYAAGEAAANGVHGANRLASNSLLEGVVFGARAGRAMRNEEGASPALDPPVPQFPVITETELRNLAWEHCGILRHGDTLREAELRLNQVASGAHDDPARSHFERRNIYDVTRLIAKCALAREESRGGHFRLDFPQKEDRFRKHSTIRIESGLAPGDVQFE